ncbi:MAG: FAD-dependent oxidoreductase [Acidobacteria bacterium]|nr:MAG: FAD-dependent oxidoreductase [Acidobacteriota bacterium]
MVETLRAEVTVVGAGPAGIAAACRAAEAGRRVLLLDENPRAGGQIWRGADRRRGSAVARRWLARLADSSARLVDTTAVVDLLGDRVLLTERQGEALVVESERLVIASGARELFLPFPGWTLPNVLGVGGAQALLKSGASFRRRTVVIAGSGPLLLPVAAALAGAGARLPLVAEQAPHARVRRFALSCWRFPEKLLEAARYRAAFLSTALRTGVWAVAARGVEAVALTDGRRRRIEPCDFLLASYGLVPNLELPRLLGCAVAGERVTVDDLQLTTVDNVYCAGEPTGIGGLELALVEGEIAGLAAGGADREAAALIGRRRRLERFQAALNSAFAPRRELAERVEAETTICRCEDVVSRRLDPAGSLRQAKLATRVGMGPCQGRVCGPALVFLRGWESDRVRPPLRVSTLGVLASRKPQDGN